MGDAPAPDGIGGCWIVDVAVGRCRRPPDGGRSPGPGTTLVVIGLLAIGVLGAACADDDGGPAATRPSVPHSSAVTQVTGTQVAGQSSTPDTATATAVPATSNEPAVTSASAPPSAVTTANVGDPGSADVGVVTNDDVRTRADDAVGAGVRPVDFTTVVVRVTSVDGEVCEVCLWLADDDAERQRGLMGVTDLGGPVGMAFVWDAPIEGRFYMLGTPTPLSIAWFGSDGGFLSETDMSPCESEDAAACARYGSTGPFDLAIEMFEGELDAAGIGPGSSVDLVAGSESPACGAVFTA